MSQKICHLKLKSHKTFQLHATNQFFFQECKLQHCISQWLLICIQKNNTYLKIKTNKNRWTKRLKMFKIASISIDHIFKAKFDSNFESSRVRTSICSHEIKNRNEFSSQLQHSREEITSKIFSFVFFRKNINWGEPPFKTHRNSSFTLTIKKKQYNNELTRNTRKLKEKIQRSNVVPVNKKTKKDQCFITNHCTTDVFNIMPGTYR